MMLYLLQETRKERRGRNVPTALARLGANARGGTQRSVFFAGAEATLLSFLQSIAAYDG